MAMRVYDRDEYEDLDEYEEDGEEQEEEDGVGEEEHEEEEALQPTQEEIEYLELRKRLKDSIRKQMKKESGSGVPNSLEKKNKLPYDNYGSFFGPSQPVIAQRVIQESKSLLENQHLAAKVTKPHHDRNKNSVSATAGSKNQFHDHRPKVVNELKSKVQKLKDTRDYSFLLSDDAELPAPSKDPPSRNISVPNSEARSAQLSAKIKQSATNTGRQVPNGREERRPMSAGSQMHAKTGSHKLTSASKPSLASVESRKQLVNSNGSGPGRPLGSKGLPSVDSRRQLGNNSGSGPGRPLGPKGLPSKVPAATSERRVSVAGTKSSMTSVHKPSSSKLQSMAPRQSAVLKQPLDQKKEFQESNKGKMLPKQPGPSSKPQINKPPAKKTSRPTFKEDRPKKKPTRRYSDDEEDDDEGASAINMIRKMFRYNPNKYASRDYDDDSDMEVNFDDIMREEKKSAKIARMEDEEELRKTEEEDRRERLRKEAKKRKMSQR